MELLFQRTWIRDPCVLCAHLELWLKEAGWAAGVPQDLRDLDSAIGPVFSCCSASRAPQHMLKEAARLWLWPQKGEKRGQTSLAFSGLKPLAALVWTSGHSGPGEVEEEGLRGDLGCQATSLLVAPSPEGRDKPRAQNQNPCLPSLPDCHVSACLMLVPSTRQVPRVWALPVSALQDGQ